MSFSTQLVTEGLEKDIRDLVADDKIDEAIKRFREFADSNHPNATEEMSNDGIGLSGRWKELKRKIEDGELSGDEIPAAKAKLRKAIIDSVGRMRDGVAPSRPKGAVTEFGGEFRKRVAIFRHLNAYKVLHDTLHKLDGDLPVIEPEAEACWTAGTAASKATTGKLRKYAADAAKAARRTDSSDDLGEWMTLLGSSVEGFLASADAKVRREAFRSLQNLPSQKLGELNSGLVRCAKELSLPGLLLLAKQARAEASPDLAGILDDFIAPVARLDGLIRAHNLCQRIDSQLRSAIDAEAKDHEGVPMWESVLKWLAEIAALRPGDEPLADVRKAADAFGTGTESIDGLGEKFGHFFLDVDGTLREVTQDMLEAVLPLLNHPEIP